jgi:hypothetical protein
LKADQNINALIQNNNIGAQENPFVVKDRFAALHAAWDFAQNKMQKKAPQETKR